MASVMDYFQKNSIEYQPESLYYDVAKCIGQAWEKLPILIFRS